MNDHQAKTETYLGDGAYAAFDGYMIAVTADKGSPQERTIWLEPAVYSEFVRFANRVWGQP